MNPVLGGFYLLALSKEIREDITWGSYWDNNILPFPCYEPVSLGRRVLGLERAVWSEDTKP